MTRGHAPDRRTKIVATLGPATDGATNLAALLDAGVDVVRLNLAHGTTGEHEARLRMVREVAAARARNVAALADLPGPKARVGAFAAPVAFEPGQEVELAESGQSRDHRVAVPAGFLVGVQPGDQVALGDGAVLLQVTAGGARDRRVDTLVVHGATLQGSPAIRLAPGRPKEAVPTAEDRRLLEWCVRVGVEFVGVSFVQTPADLGRVRALVGDRGPLLVAKIETREAVEHLAAVIDAADAVMVARGDLGIECPLEEVPHLQKRIVATCVQQARPVITATQMLESMVHAPVPSRAEASDVANAVLDGTDAVMLSAETAIGAHPRLVVETMARIVARADAEIGDRDSGAGGAATGAGSGIAPAIGHTASRAAAEAGATAIVCATRSGRTARTIARYRPATPIVAVSPHAETVRRLALTWGVDPLLLPGPADSASVADAAVGRARGAGRIRSGDVVAVVWGSAPDGDAPTDTLRLVRVP